MAVLLRPAPAPSAAPRRAGAPSPGRRQWCLGGAALLALGGCAGLGSGPPAGRGQVAAFSAPNRLGGLPQGWVPYQPRPDRPPTAYALAERDGRQVLHARAEQSISGLRCEVDIDVQARPVLQWEWRVDQCPAGATVAEDELDDSPARVVLAFDGDHATLPLRDRLFEEQVALFTGNALPYATLAYVWDGQAARESVVHYPRSGRIRYLVVESGDSCAGRWQGYRRNVVDDYRRVFGAEPGRLVSVGVQTDSDDLKNVVEAWFGDIAVT